MMDTYTAVALVEGLDDSASEEQILAAWQYLIDTRVVWRLQGYFGRQAMVLINEGLCSAPGASA